MAVIPPEGCEHFISKRERDRMDICKQIIDLRNKGTPQKEIDRAWQSYYLLCEIHESCDNVEMKNKN